MGRYQQEVVRWNRQINLVSRKGTLSLVATLIRQCRDAFAVLWESELREVATGSPVWYFDLGSGGGLPGYAWHHELSILLPELKTWLVEPREKRAWFLERLNQITPEQPVEVLEGLWGDCRPDVDGLAAPGVILVSLKALRLSDAVVLQGISDSLGESSGAAGKPLDLAGCRVLIARFYPPEQAWDTGLQAELAPLERTAGVGVYKFAPGGQAVLSPRRTGRPSASLVVSRYEILQ